MLINGVDRAALDLFTVPIVDMKAECAHFEGIFMPEPEIGLEKIGITEQFLANADQYHQRYANEGHFARLFEEAFEVAKEALDARLVLDIGTGSGHTIGALLNQIKNSRIVATDLSPNLLYILRKNLVNQGDDDRVICICANAMSNYFKGSAFDLVVGSAILHHLLDPTEAFKAAFHALKPGGYAIWFEPFEIGIRTIRLIYKIILREKERGLFLREDVADIFRRLILDSDVRAGTDKTPDHYKFMDDKWLFTERYVRDAANAAGFDLIDTLPHNRSPDLFRTYITTELRLAGPVAPDAMPEWAWEIVDMFNQNFSDAAKQDLSPEATIILRKPLG